MGFTLALAAAALYGAADFLGGLAGRRAHVTTVTAWSQAVGLALLLAVAPFVPGVPSRVDLLWGAGAGLSGGFGVLLLYRALATGTVSVAAPIINLVGLTLPVAVGLLTGERPGALAISGIGVGAVAVALLGGWHRGELHRRGLGTALASGVCIGVFLVCLGHVHAGTGLWPVAMARAVGTLVLVATVLAQRAPAWPGARAAWWALAGAGAGDVVANTLYVTSRASVPLSIAAPLVTLAPATTVLLAQVFLREPLTRSQRAGLALAAVALLMLSRASV